VGCGFRFRAHCHGVPVTSALSLGELAALASHGKTHNARSAAAAAATSQHNDKARPSTVRRDVASRANVIIEHVHLAPGFSNKKHDIELLLSGAGTVVASGFARPGVFSPVAPPRTHCPTCLRSLRASTRRAECSRWRE
jgi:hypothetical protein